MAVRPILQIGDPRLRQKAKRVSRIDDSIQRLIDDLIDTMRAAQGVGLAATQVGVPLRIAVIELPPGEPEGPKPEVIVLINPQIVRTSGEELMDEACLSIPGFAGEIRRFRNVTVKALNRQGKEFRVKGTGLLAQALQHEIDHLDGVLYVDRAERVEKLEERAPSQQAHPPSQAASQ